MLQQGADEVDQLGVEDPGVLALDDILPDNGQLILINQRLGLNT